MKVRNFDFDVIEKFPNEIISITLTGSQVLPWIKNPHDFDYRVVLKNARDPKLIARLFVLKPPGQCWFGVNNNIYMFKPMFFYQVRFEQHIYGDQNEGPNMFEEHLDVKKSLIKFWKYQKNNLTIKKWYHILTNIYMFENGEHFLTDEQAANVQLCHDCQMTPEIYEFIQTKLAEYEKELQTIENIKEKTLP